MHLVIAYTDGAYKKRHHLAPFLMQSICAKGELLQLVQILQNIIIIQPVSICPLLK